MNVYQLVRGSLSINHTQRENFEIKLEGEEENGAALDLISAQTNLIATKKQRRLLIYLPLSARKGERVSRFNT